MRIDALNQISQVYGANGVKKTNQAARTSASDQLEISSFGRDLQVAKQAVADSPDIREDRVADVKNRIKSGTYNVTAEEFADHMISKYDQMA